MSGHRPAVMRLARHFIDAYKESNMASVFRELSTADMNCCWSCAFVIAEHVHAKGATLSFIRFERVRALGRTHRRISFALQYAEKNFRDLVVLYQIVGNENLADNSRFIVYPSGRMFWLWLCTNSHVPFSDSFATFFASFDDVDATRKSQTIYEQEQQGSSELIYLNDLLQNDKAKCFGGLRALLDNCEFRDEFLSAMFTSTYSTTPKYRIRRDAFPRDFKVATCDRWWFQSVRCNIGFAIRDEASREYVGVLFGFAARRLSNPKVRRMICRQFGVTLTDSVTGIFIIRGLYITPSKQRNLSVGVSVCLHAFDFVLQELGATRLVVLLQPVSSSVEYWRSVWQFSDCPVGGWVLRHWPPLFCSECKMPCNKRCSRCKSIFYCDVRCQRKDWPRHKLGCKSPKTVG
jgi:hypothetical protein